MLSYGCPDSSNVLIQLVDDYSLEIMGSEVAAIKALSKKDFQLKAIKVEQWNHDLSPWKAPTVFGTEPFGDGAADTLKKVLTLANLAKSIVIEAGELLECYQWQNEADLEHVRQELADVIVYCRNMLDALGLDEDEIVNAKMDQNEKKYPIDKAYGSNKKYTGF